MASPALTPVTLRSLRRSCLFRLPRYLPPLVAVVLLLPASLPATVFRYSLEGMLDDGGGFAGWVDLDSTSTDFWEPPSGYGGFPASARLTFHGGAHEGIIIDTFASLHQAGPDAYGPPSPPLRLLRIFDGVPGNSLDLAFGPAVFPAGPDVWSPFEQTGFLFGAFSSLTVPDELAVVWATITAAPSNPVPDSTPGWVSVPALGALWIARHRSNKR